MISIIIRVEKLDGRDPGRLLAETVTPLVSGVVQGIVGRLIIVDVSGLPKVGAIAEEAGAVLIKAANWQSGLDEAARHLMTDWVLVFDCGVLTEPSLWPCLERHIRAGGDFVGVSQIQWSLKRAVYQFLGRIMVDQAVLIRRRNINNQIFEKSFGKKIMVMQTRTIRLKL